MLFCTKGHGSSVVGGMSIIYTFSYTNSSSSSDSRRRGPEVVKLLFMLNLVETKIYPAHK